MCKTTIFIIQLCVIVKLFSLEDACGFIVETASFYIVVESGGCMHMVNTMVITLNICMAMRTYVRGVKLTIQELIPTHCCWL